MELTADEAFKLIGMQAAELFKLRAYAAKLEKELESLMQKPEALAGLAEWKGNGGKTPVNARPEEGTG